jgi:hypothetical protein
MEQFDALAEAVGIRWRLMAYLGEYGPMRPEVRAEQRRNGVDTNNVVIVVREATEGGADLPALRPRPAKK